MNSALQLVKNLFKLGLVALQYSIVRLNLDVRSTILRDFVKSEAPKVNEYTTTPTQKQERGESDAPPYIGHGDNMRAYTRFELDPNYDIHKEYGPIK